MKLARRLVLGFLAAQVSSLGWAADPAPAAVNPPLISQAELLKRLEDPELVVLDVRTALEFAAGHVPGAINLSHDLLATRIADISDRLHDKQVVLYCRTGRRTLLAADTLQKFGFTRLLHLEGDYAAWSAARQPVEVSSE